MKENLGNKKLINVPDPVARAMIVKNMKTKVRVSKKIYDRKKIKKEFNNE